MMTLPIGIMNLSHSMALGAALGAMADKKKRWRGGLVGAGLGGLMASQNAQNRIKQILPFVGAGGGGLPAQGLGGATGSSILDNPIKLAPFMPNLSGGGQEEATQSLPPMFPQPIPSTGGLSSFRRPIAPPIQVATSLGRYYG